MEFADRGEIFGFIICGNCKLILNEDGNLNQF